jgi:hypothetical protein
MPAERIVEILLRDSIIEGSGRSLNQRVGGSSPPRLTTNFISLPLTSKRNLRVD